MLKSPKSNLYPLFVTRPISRSWIKDGGISHFLNGPESVRKWRALAYSWWPQVIRGRVRVWGWVLREWEWVLTEQACKNENIRNEVEDGSWLLIWSYSPLQGSPKVIPMNVRIRVSVGRESKRYPRTYLNTHSLTCTDSDSLSAEFESWVEPA